MLVKDSVRYSYNDVMIQPAAISGISSRSECDINKAYELMQTSDFGLCKAGSGLPIFTAPMSSVVSETNYKVFKENSICPIIPRSVDYKKRLSFIEDSEEWVALSLKEFENLFCNGGFNVNHLNDARFTRPHVLIDIANGHMESLYDAVKKAKSIYGSKILVMAGNIANPATYLKATDAGVDYIRVGIGGGAGCITSSNTGIHDGIASLLDDIHNLKRSDAFLHKTWPKIIADGGIRNYSDVIKALALGADYVMIGSIFAQLYESAADLKVYDNLDYPDAYSIYSAEEVCNISIDNNNMWHVCVPEEIITRYAPEKVFYGMASKYGQQAINGSKTKTSEGIMKMLPVTSSVKTWADNMKSYLQSAMSYCGIRNIIDFNADNVIVQIISSNTKQSINQ